MKIKFKKLLTEAEKKKPEEEEGEVSSPEQVLKKVDKIQGMIKNLKGEKPEEKPAEEPAEKPAEEPAEEPAEKPVEEPVEELQKGDSFEYASKTGKESAVQVIDPENEHGATVAQKIDPNTCEPVKNTQFASKPASFMAAAGEPIEKCSVGGEAPKEGEPKTIASPEAIKPAAKRDITKKAIKIRIR